MSVKYTASPWIDTFALNDWLITDDCSTSSNQSIHNLNVYVSVVFGHIINWKSSASTYSLYLYVVKPLLVDVDKIGLDFKPVKLPLLLLLVSAHVSQVSDHLKLSLTASLNPSVMLMLVKDILYATG